MTFDDIARDLGVSKSTVSRALSGKGRIGEETRNRIIAYANHQKLEEEKEQKGELTHNLGVVFPEDVYVNGNPYFHDCLLGICETAAILDYNVLLATGTAMDISKIRKLVEHKKVDGIILTRSLENDKAIEYLLKQNFPVGLTGLYEDERVIQVDTDNESAAENMTSLLISKGFRRFALLVEDLEYHVNRSRYDGFQKALLKNGIGMEHQAVYTGNLKMDSLDSILADMMSKKIQCVLCGDDIVCTKVMSKLQADGYRIPRDIAIAAFYNSQNLESFSPPITAVNISARQIGNTIGKQMISALQGKEYQKKTFVDFEILFRKSTNQV